MEISITKETYNPLIKRKEIEATITHVGETTPTRDAVKSKIAAQINVDLDRVVIRSIVGHFGEPRSKLIVHCYDDPKDISVYEPEYLLKRNKLIAEEKSEG
ncbi:MAG: 30S ribosomal protein S24e [Candidatus Hodarchaeales archaeon]